MPPLSSPLRFVLVALAGWMNQQQRHVIDYLQEENRALREQLGPGRLRFTDDQRRRLAAKAKTLGRRVWVANSQSCRKDARTTSLAVIRTPIAEPESLIAHAALLHSVTEHMAAV